MCYGQRTIDGDCEYGSSIYEIEIGGITYYSYNEPNKGSVSDTTRGYKYTVLFNKEVDGVIVGTIHSHPDDGGTSGSIGYGNDLDLAEFKKEGTFNYVYSANGIVRRYNYYEVRNKRGDLAERGYNVDVIYNLAPSKEYGKGYIHSEMADYDEIQENIKNYTNEAEMYQMKVYNVLDFMYMEKMNGVW